MVFEYRSLPFTQAIDFFRAKVNVPTASYQDVWEHDIAFVVAGATKATLLADFRQAVDEAIATGKTRQEFQKDFDRIVATHGWEHRGGREWRANIIYGTNLRTAYAAGRWEQMTDPDILRMRPYWMYKHGNSPHPRLHHLALDGKVFPADDPWWQYNFPPNGWGCKCLAVSLSIRDVERMGKEVETPPRTATYTWTNPIDGKKYTILNQPDPGWNYTPGRSTPQEKAQIFQNILQNLPDDLRFQVEQDAVQRTQQAGNIFKQSLFQYLIQKQYQKQIQVFGIPEMIQGNFTGYFQDGNITYYGQIEASDNSWVINYGRLDSES
jgi:SPP1 gp7 family putative phage head morphogenesis protein